MVHEMSLMADTLNIILTNAEEKGIHQVEKVVLLVGEFSNAMPESLEMAFDIYRHQGVEGLSPDAVLEIIREEGWAECTVCHHQFKPEMGIVLCPQCGLPSGKLLKGEKLQVVSYEGS